MALDCGFVLRRPIDAALRRDILRSHPHMNLVERIAQRTGKRVEHLDVAHLLAEPRAGHIMRRLAHILGAARDRHAAFTKRNALCRGDDRL